MSAGPGALEGAKTGFAPTRIDQVELGAPLPALPARGAPGEPLYSRSLCLVRLHGAPLGMVELELGPDGLAAEELAAAIAARFSEEIAAHLRADGLDAAELGAEGLPGPDPPPCNADRERMLADAPFASIVICTRDRPDSVRETLGSILETRYPRDRFEIVVVDNASADDAAVALAAAESDGDVSVRVVREPMPGLSRARNAGLREAEGEIVVFADDDVAVDRDWLATLIAPFARDPAVGASSGMTLPMALDTQVESWVEDFGGRLDRYRERVFDLEDPPPDRPLFPFTVGDFGAGRNMAFRRDVIAGLGGFDPALGPGTIAHDGDDIEALLRVLLSGRRLAHVPKAIVWHAHPREYSELEQRVWGYGIGLTACLTRAVLDHPRLLIGLARRLPRGLVFALSPGSEKNAGREDQFPRSLARRELLGMAYGPIAYVRSRRDQRRRERAVARDGQPPGEANAGGLRILIVTDEYRPYIGGAGLCIGLFAHELTRLGHTIAIATAWHPDAPAFELDRGVEIHRIRDLPSRMRWISEDRNRHTPPPFPDPEAVVRLRRLSRRFKPDLVPAYGWLAHSAAAALVGQSIPFVLWGHDYGNTCAVRTLVRKDQICSGPGVAKCLACASSTRGAVKGVVSTGSVFASRPLLRRKAAALHGVSRFVGEVMQRDLPSSAPTVVIPNFHGDDPGEPIDPRFESRLPAEPFILFIGALRPVKGVPELLAAYARLEEPPPMVLAGHRTPDSPEEFPPGITVFNDVPHATVMALWDRALFGVFPSTWPEPLATVVHEAMSKGRPVIATRVGGHVDMVDDGESGLLVEPRDVEGLARAMSLLVEDPGLRERLGAEARLRSERYTRDVVVGELERFYRETVAAAEAGSR